MAADYSAYDAGTAYLTIKARLDDNIEADLATQLSAIRPMPIALTADLDQFASDLDQNWKDLDHHLKVQIDPVTADQINEDVGTLKIPAELKTEAAEAKLREFYSLVPVYTIPTMLDTTVADAQLDELRAKAAEPLAVPAPAQDARGRGVSTSAAGAPSDRYLDAFQKDLLTRMSRAQAQAERTLPLTAEGEQLRQVMSGDAAAIRNYISRNLTGTNPADALMARQGMFSAVSGFTQQLGRYPQTTTDTSAAGALAKMEQEDRNRVAAQAKEGQRQAAEANAARVKADQEAAKAQQESSANVVKGFESLGKNINLGGLLKSVPLLSGKGGWGELLGMSGEGAEVGGAAAGAAAAALTALVDAAKQGASALIDLAEKAGKAALIGGAIGLGGGLLADAGAVGITGLLGSRNVMGALQAGSALHQWQIDPNAQLQQQQSMISAQEEQITSAQGLQRAQWDVQDATVAAVVSTEQLSMANQNALLAQRSLNDAYKESGRSVRDMNSALTDARLQQEGSAIAVAEARRNLLRVSLDPGSDLIDRQSAEFEVRAAQQRYLESKNKTADQTVDTAISNQRGVAQSTQVLQAIQGVQQASIGVQQATQSQIDSQHQLISAMWSVQQATVGIQQAAIALKLAMNPQPVDDYAVALGKLSPAAREFVQGIQSLRPEMRQLEDAVSAQMFDGLFGAIKQFIDTQGLGIASAMTGIAQGINSGLKQTLIDVGNLFTKMQQDGTWDKFVAGAQALAKNISPVITGFLDLFMQLGAKTSGVVGPLLQQLGQSLQQIAPALGDLAAAFGKGLTDALPSLTDMFSALAETGATMMPALSTLFQTIAEAVTQVAPDIGPFVSALATDFASFIQGLTSSGGMKKLADDFVLLAQNLGPLMEPLGKLIGHTLPALFSAITNDLPDFVRLVDKFGDWYDKAKPVIDIVGGFIEHGLPGLTGALHDLASPLADIVGAFETWWGWLDKLLSGVGQLSSSLRDWLGLGGGDSRAPAVFGGGGGDGTFAVGGPVSGPGTGTSDSIHAMLSDGEYVVNARASAAHRPLLDAINYGAPGFAMGGVIRAGGDALLARDVTKGKYARAIRRIAEKNIPRFASGGPVNARQWGEDHPNIPYIWGGSDVSGVDCSGYVGLLQQVAMGVGNPSARLGVTGDLVSGAWPRFVKGATSDDAFIVGANADHMAARILGENFEARQPGENVRVGAQAASPFDAQFTVVGHVDPAAFQPPYNAGGGTPTQAGVDQNAAATDRIAAEGAPVQAKNISTWSGWAGDTVTNMLTSLATFGTPLPPLTGADTAAQNGPMAGLAKALTGAANNAPKDQQGWLNRFFFGASTSPSAQVDTGTAPAGAPPAVSTPSNPNAGTANAPDTQGTDAIATETPGGGVMGALQHAVGGFAQAAGEAVSGQISSALGVLGGGSSLDQVPGWVKAAYQGYLLTLPQPALPDVTPGTTVTGGDQQQNASAQKPQTAPQHPAPTAETHTPGTPDAPLNKMAQQKTGIASGDNLNAMAEAGTPAGALPPLHTYNPGQGVNQWTGTFAGVLNSLGMPQSWLPLGLEQMQTESGGNPQAINLSDSNAAAGHPSKGLMQVIDPTFAQEYPKFSSKGYPDDVYDPRSNIAAGLEWVIQAYGSPVGTWGQGHGYAAGGPVSGDGSSIGDMIPAMLSNGEYVVNARAADMHAPLLDAINSDATGANRLQLRQSIPVKGLVGAGATRGGVDNSASYTINAADVEQGFRRAALYQEQRSATYLGRWR